MFKMLCVISLCIFLQSCAVQRIPQELQRGKVSFAAGDFRQSFKDLLPLASENNPDAEYAVGYMYYYGYGVSRDQDAGLFWMRKAAAQHFAPAIKALSML